MVIKMRSTNARSTHHSRYIRTIHDMPLLTEQQEQALTSDWKTTNNIKSVDKLIVSHLKLVAKIATLYRGYGFNEEDLIAEGNLGLVRAIKNFDPSKGFRFSTYAIWWIKASIQEYILQNWSLVKMGTTKAQKKLFFNLRKMQRAIEGTTESSSVLTPKALESISEKLSVREDEIIMMRNRLSGRDQSLNAPLSENDGEDAEWINFVEDQKETPEAIVLHNDETKKRQEIFQKALLVLKPRENMVFFDRRLREEPLTLEEISEKLGLSRERVRQIENKAFEKVQKSIKKIITESAPNSIIIKKHSH